MAFNEKSLDECVILSKETWKPTINPNAHVRHYSIPAYDQGSYEITESSNIASNKFLISSTSILFSKLNPMKPRIWRVDPVDDMLSVTSTEFVVFVPKIQSDIYYIEAVLNSSQFKNSAVALVNGTSGSHQRVSPKDLLDIRIPWPEDEIQRHVIGGTFQILSEKIVSNTKVSATLEQIAKTIFKSWFVDFDPVHAKSRGEQPEGMDAETAALFPNSFENSKLGLLPTNWVLRQADDLFDMTIGRTPPRKEPEWFCDGKSGVPWVSIRDMGTFGVFSSFTTEALTQEAVAKFRVPVVPTGSVLMSFKLTIGKLCITDGPVVTNEAIAHFKQKASSLLSSEFAYLWLKHFDIETLDSTSSIATATNSEAIRSIDFLVPDAAIARRFDSIVSPIFAQIKTLKRESQTLKELRDSLLPRLISGDLEIPAELMGD